MVRKALGSLLFLCAVGWVAALQGTGPPVVCIVNEAATSLSNVVLTTTGGRKAVGELAPGARRCCLVEALGESGLAISFTTSGRSVSADDLAYLESSGGYCEVVRVDAEMQVTSAFRDPKCSFLASLACRLTRRCS